jgi:hypothetical protein
MKSGTCAHCGIVYRRKTIPERSFCGRTCYHKSREGSVSRPPRLSELPESAIRQSVKADFATGQICWTPRPRDHFLTDRSWKISNSNAGKSACSSAKKYPRVNISYQGHAYPILVHRLVWFLAYGEWPAMLDHIDRDTTNNALSNLREATPQQNQANRRSQNRNGLKGICAIHTGKFRSSIKVSGRTIGLGTFSTAEEAHAAYMEAAHHYFGEFASC